MKRISAIRWTVVWMLVGLLGFVCSGFATALSSGAWMGEGKAAGETRTITLPGGATMDLVWVAPGSFQMGSNDGNPGEKPVHKVTLTKGYWIGKFEVTQKQWQSVMGNNPSHFKGDDLPVEKVSWNDCQEFLLRVNMGCPEIHLSLPTEAQWEFAARGGTKSKGYRYAGSDDVKKVAWYCGNSGGKTHPVGTLSANELGLHDMSGNVWEWCQDRYGTYPSDAVTDPLGPPSGDCRVVRGGSWGNDAGDCRSAIRIGDYPGDRSGNLGFRVVASAGTVTDGGSPGREPVTTRPPKPAERAGAGATERASGAWMGDGLRNGEKRTITLPGGATMDLVWVEPGSFDMDSDYRVVLTKGYWIGKTEVTQKQWKSVMGGNPSEWKGEDLPVECVSWNDCQEFLQKVNASNPELRLALPTEAQWAFAARGGTRSLGFEYAGSNNPKEVGWFEENSGGLFSSRKTHPVGKKKPNELGLYDMSGNVWEWCQDWYGDYPSGAVADPTGLSSGCRRVNRGGSWFNYARFCRSAIRDRDLPDLCYGILGFRVVASAGP